MKFSDKIDWPVNFWIISGGEPFIAKHIDQVAIEFARHDTRYITIPTNALMPETIAEKVEHILSGVPPRVELNLNISVDGIGGEHDKIRGVPGNFMKVERTIELVHKLRKRFDNLNLTTHTVVSNYNIDRVPEIIDRMKKYPLDNHITEMAEERWELSSMGKSITPTPDQYRDVVRYLKLGLKEKDRIRSGLRKRYYDIAARTISEKTQVIPCYAGWASCHIAETGLVTACCTRWLMNGLMGNLRSSDYDLRSIWVSEKANVVRKSIKKKECACPLASAAYTSMLMDPGSLTTVAGHFLRDSLAGS